MFLEPGLLGALSEGQRTIAHLVILVALAIVAGVIYFIYRARRRD
jgi:cbb3-type cytochrome oxidase subunit 3